MNVALDTDGTITAMPSLFAVLSCAVRAFRGKVIIVTSQANTPEVRDVTRRELRGYGVEFDDLFVIPDGTDRIPCPHSDLCTYEQYLWQKVAVCLDRGVDVVFEDDENFRRFAPGIRTFRVA
jgi:hypothetical protein